VRCFHCDSPLPSAARHCPRCERPQPRDDRVGDSVDYGVLATISMGRHPLARRFGNIFAAASALFVVVALFRAMRHSGEETDPFGAFIFAGMLGYFAYEIWAFTHGRPTSIDSYRHEATLDRTGWRVFGLLLDVALWYACVRAIKSW
jgi:hypothetical protein